MISEQHYCAYFQTFNQQHLIKPANNCTITGIGGISKADGVVLIQVPFAELSVVIGVNFLALDQNNPPLLSMMEMLENDLQISIQD